MLPRCIATLSRMLLQRNWLKPVSRTRLPGRTVRSWDRCGVGCPLVQSVVLVVVVSVTVVRVP